MQQQFQFRDSSQIFWEYICTCGAKMSTKFLQKQKFRCPMCGRKKSETWRKVKNTTLAGVV